MNNFFNLEAEQSILGTIILNNENLNRVSEFLKAEHFYEPAHQKIYQRILQNIDKVNVVANQITLKQFFESDESIKAIGGVSYLAILLENASQIIDIIDYAKVVCELAAKRNLLKILTESTESIEEKTSQEAKEEIIANLDRIETERKQKTISLKDSIDISFEKKSENFIYSGYSELDNILGGFSYGSLIVLAGRPAMGKSALCVNIATRVATSFPVLLFSLEMGHQQITKRIIANESSINVTKLRHCNISSQHELEAFDRAKQTISKLPIFIKDEGGITLQKIRYEIKRFVNKHKGKLVIIDYIQLIRSTSKENRVQQITEITTTLKSMAREFEIVIIGLSQLSRAVEQRDDKRPQLSDLRDSGSIEQDADVVMFTFRPEYYLENERPEEQTKNYSESLRKWQADMNRLKGVAYVIVSKNRDGKCGEAKLRFEGEFSRFAEVKC